jgi:hypothetical protein
MGINSSLNASIHNLKDYLASTNVCPKTRIDDHLARVLRDPHVRENLRVAVYYEEERFKAGKTPLDLVKYREKIRNIKTEEKVDAIILRATKDHPTSQAALDELMAFGEEWKNRIRQWSH